MDSPKALVGLNEPDSSYPPADVSYLSEAEKADLLCHSRKDLKICIPTMNLSEGFD